MAADRLDCAALRVPRVRKEPRDSREGRVRKVLKA